MTDLTWNEFQEDKKRAEQQMSLILNEFREKYKVAFVEVNTGKVIYEDLSMPVYHIELEVKI